MENPTDFTLTLHNQHIHPHFLFRVVFSVEPHHKKYLYRLRKLDSVEIATGIAVENYRRLSRQLFSLKSEKRGGQEI